MTVAPVTDATHLQAALVMGGLMVVSCGAVMKFSQFMDKRRDELSRGDREK